MVRHFGSAIVGLLFILRSIAEFVGYIDPAPGTATGTHVLGVTFGLAWFLYRTRR